MYVDVIHTIIIACRMAGAKCDGENLEFYESGKLFSEEKLSERKFSERTF